MAQTRADRLMAIITKMAPSAAAFYQARGGRWPQRSDDTRPPLDADSDNEAVSARGKAPYEIQTLPDGGIRIRLYTPDGDVVTGAGATMDAALAALESKAGLATEID